jgi:sporulation protein YlmC with PRC-barrel domain
VIPVSSVSARVLIGGSVVDIHGVPVGRIEDLIVDLRTGSIAYAALSVERSLLGNGQTGRVVLPWSALLLDWVENRVENTFTLDVDTDLLRKTGVFAYYTYPTCTPC